MHRILIAFLLMVMFISYAGWIKTPSGFSIAAPAGQGGNPNTIVWVDTAKGVYYCPGNQSYDKGNGRRMSQSEAQQKGYRPAYGWVCK